MDMKLEVVVVPVSDVDRAKAFYQSLGWRLDADFPGEGGFRVVQLTPPGSACSIIFGSGVTSAAPGSAEGLQLVVTDIEAARAEVVERGVEVSDVFHDAGGVFHHAGTEARAAGPRSGAQDLWVVRLVQRSGRQQLVHPRGDNSPSGAVSTPMPATYGSADDLAAALRRAEEAHGRHEQEIGHPDPDWPDWYAQYMIDEQSGPSEKAGAGAST